MPCPHFNIRIVSRAKGESVMAAAAYQSGEKLYSEYDGEWKSGDHAERVVFKNILLPPNASKAYADRQTLWNAVDASESRENAQTARRFIIALPKKLSIEDNIRLIQEYCQAQFVDILALNIRGRTFTCKNCAMFGTLKKELSLLRLKAPFSCRGCATGLISAAVYSAVQSTSSYTVG